MDKERQVLHLVRPAARLEDEAEKERLYRENVADMTRYAARHVEPEDVEDVVHDAFAKFLAQRDRERDRARETGRAPLRLSESDARIRLMVMLGDVIIDRQRTQNAQSRLKQLISKGTAAIRRRMNTRRSAEDNEILDTIHRAVTRLPEYLREPWLLVVEHGYSYKEAAEIHRIEPESCRKFVRLANEQLREHLTRRGLTPDSLRGRDSE